MIAAADTQQKIARGYVRVSTIDQAVHGMGLKAQKRQVRLYYRAFLKPKGYAWGGIYVDKGVSAWKKRMLGRKAGLALNAASSRGDHIIIAKCDRAFRSLSDQIAMLDLWEKQGITCNFLDMPFVDTTTPTGKLLLNILSAIAEFESRRRSERLRDAYAERKRLKMTVNGRAGFGRVAVGTKGTSVKNSHERKVMALIVHLRATIKLPWEEISRMLMRSGLKRRDVHAPATWCCESCRRAHAAAVAEGLAGSDAILPDWRDRLEPRRRRKLGLPPMPKGYKPPHWHAAVQAQRELEVRNGEG